MTSVAPPPRLAKSPEVRELSRNGVTLRVPREADYPLLVELRNRERRWFVDRREIHGKAAAEWFAARDVDDLLLCIETGGVVVGTVGWSRVPAPGRIFEFGRTIADYRGASENGVARAQVHRAIRLAMFMVADCLAYDMAADMVYIRIRPHNGYPRKLLQLLGLRRQTWPYESSGPELECWGGNPSDWAVNRERVLALIGEDHARSNSD